jgi:3-oxoacyl-[acyl-carrier-protein] synthase-3
MDSVPTVGLVSAGVYLPEPRITAAEISRLSGIPEDVVINKLGIQQKPVPGPADHTNAMALWAAEDAFAQTSIKPAELDLILCTTEEWKEYPLWTAGIKLAYDLGATHAWAIDVQMRCATTMATVKLAKAMMVSDPNINTVLIAGGYRNGDFIDYTNLRSRSAFGLSAGAGALLLQKNYPRNLLLESAVMVDGSFSLDVIIPVGGTIEPLTADNLASGRYKIDVPDPEGMKERLDRLSMQNFLNVIDQALSKSSLSRGDIGYLNILHMKPSAHQFVLHELGLREDQSYYLGEYGHIGQHDQALSIKKGLESGRLRDGMVMVMVAAGIGYAWSASVIKWGPK